MVTAIAAIQMTSGADKSRNVETALRLSRLAVEQGASIIGLPEVFNWMGPTADQRAAAETLEGPTLVAMAGFARDHSVTLIAGSILELGAPDGRLYNTNTVFGPDGKRLAVYRKMHLFDVELGDGATYKESASVAPGESPVVVETTLGTIGLSVCYDLRFPELYRRLSEQGATLLSVPAAFTLTTGKDHWEVLLRARAIENQAYVMAPAQWGRHSEHRVTYGNAVIVDPWGAVISRCSEGEGFALARYDPAMLERIRRDLPALRHRRL